MEETVEIYKGFVIRSYIVGRYTARRNYRCGNELAPTKKLVKQAIDTYLTYPDKYELDLTYLEKENKQTNEEYEH